MVQGQRSLAEPPAEKFVSLLQGGLGEWKIKPASTVPLNRRTNMNAYFRDGANFTSDWQSETALESYLQIQEAFGWEVFQKLLESYQDYDEPRRWNDRQEINDEWVERISKICGVDLTPFYRTWGPTVSDRVATKTGTLPPWEEDPVRKFRN